MSPGSSFTTRLTLPVIAIAALVIGAGLALDYHQSKNRLLTIVEGNARQAVEDATLRIGEMSAGVETAVRLLSRALRSAPDEETAASLLRSALASNRHIDAAAIILSSGRDGEPTIFLERRDSEHAGLTRSAAPAATQLHAWLAEAEREGGPFWTSAATGTREPRAAFFVEPFPDGDDAPVLGLIVAAVALEDLHGYLEGLRIDHDGFGFLLTPTGIAIGAPRGIVRAADADEMLAPLSPVDWEQWLAAPREPLRSRVACPRREGECEFRVHAVENSRWYVGTVYSPRSLLQPLQEYELRTIALGLAMLALIAALVIAITRHLTRPLLSLTAASEAIARGQLDGDLPPAPGDDELGRLVRSFDTMRRDLATHIRTIEQSAEQRSRLEGELSAARDIQMAMVPQSGEARHSGGYALWARLRPARAVGGDLYSFEERGAVLRFAVGDVSDKGVPAALFMARAMGLIQQWERDDGAVAPAQALVRLNEALVRDNENCMFLTLFLGELHLARRTLSYASAGHSAPLLLRDGAVQVLAQERGPALGLAPGLAFPDNRTSLEADDRLVLYTDGFDEAINPRNEAFGEERLARAIRDADDLPLADAGEALFHAIDRFADGCDQADDMTLLLLEPTERRNRPLQVCGTSLPVDDQLVATATRWLEEQWQVQGLESEGLQDLQLVQEELLCNLREHSGLDERSSVTLKLLRYATRVELECVDPGPAFNPLEDGERSLLGEAISDAAIGGLGLHLITQLTQRQSYTRELGRNILRVTKVFADGDTQPEN